MSQFAVSEEPERTHSTPATWTIFCAVVDNHGDIGVCWRLARQLVSEHEIDVVLWVDDLQAFAGFLGVQEAEQMVAGVQVRHWASPWPAAFATDALIVGSAVVIEAFACELPDSLVKAFAQCAVPPLWINLEYLSAESWVPQCHGLSSMLSVDADKSINPESATRILSRTFFFPGFVAGTAGLLREHGLLTRHALWQEKEQQGRSQLLEELGLSAALAAVPKLLWISVFAYESSALASWFDALAEGDEPTLCLVPTGRVLVSIERWLGGAESLAPGNVVRIGSLSIAVIPFMPQDDYDRLLSLCDLNVVRGEDSFVRAQWAARPLLWHIYPQDEGVHMQKLEAFLKLYAHEKTSEYSRTDPGSSSDGSVETGTLSQFWRLWNQGEDCRELWHHLRPQLPGLRERAGRWQQQLAQLPDLAANLVEFSRQQSAQHQRE